MKDMSGWKFGDLWIVIAVVIAAGVGLLYWQHLKHPSDAQVRQMLPGTWAVSFGDSGDKVHVNVGYTNVIGSDGSYTYQLTDPKIGSVVANIEGTFQVSDGYLIDTMTNCSRTNVQVPHVYRGRIIKADSREMTFAFIDGGNEDVHYRKISP